jgi:excisionase family DNA binding protein
MIPSATNDNTISSDLLKGAEEIAAYLGEDRRAVYFALSKGRIPHFRIGANIRARKSTLIAWMAKQEAAA